MDAGERDERRSKRARRAAQVASDAGTSCEPDRATTGSRPTPAEWQEAMDVIQQMRLMVPPLVVRRGQPPKPNVVACALALQRGERFNDDREALRLFGAHPETKVREEWVDGKLAEFAPAGVGVAGEPSLPNYLLDRGSEAPSDALPWYIDLEALRARWAASLDNEEAAEAADHWTHGHLKEMAKRMREFVAWEATHGAERDTELADLADVGDEFYWALPDHADGRRPRWALRKGEELTGDATCTLGKNELGVEEPILLYLYFRPFTGNVAKAAEFFAARPSQRDLVWLDNEREKVKGGPSGANRSSLPRCIECGHRDCQCELGDAAADESSADCHYDGRADHELLVRRERYDRIARALLRKGRDGPIRVQRGSCDTLDRVELECECVLEEQGRVSQIHGRAWHTVPQGTTAPWHWLDDAVDRPHERMERERAQCEEREHRERLERMARANIPPPRREDERYGALADNAEGDEDFRTDRTVWYEGESLEGLSLAEQRECVDVIARRFRAYNDGRPARLPPMSR